MKQKIVFYMMAAAFAMAVVGCGDKEEEIPLWDERDPEGIAEMLVDVPAYVDTVMYEHNAYACVFYSYDADTLNHYLGIDHSKIGMIAVKVKTLRNKGIPFRSKVYVTADVTNRCRLNYDYADKILHDTFDWGGAHILFLVKRFCMILE